MNRVGLFLFYLFLFNCSSAYSQIGLTVAAVKDIPELLSSVRRTYNDTSKHSKVYGTCKRYDPAKAIFYRLKSKLGSSRNVVYQFTWQNDLPAVNGNFRAIVFDKTGEKSYYCSGSCYSKKLEIRTVPLIQDSVDQIVLNSYLTGDFDHLSSFQGEFSSAEVGEDYTVLAP
jgi:hypothetical protein